LKKKYKTRRKVVNYQLAAFVEYTQRNPLLVALLNVGSI